MLAGPQSLMKKEAVAWNTVKNSVAVLLRNGQPVGEAALIDKSGLFIANQSTVSTPTLQAKLADGRIITLTWRSTDTPTQTVLLTAEGWQEDDGVPVSLHPAGQNLSKVPVLVVLPSGPIRGQLVSSDRMGVLSSSHRLFPLSEVRFEKTLESVGGALVFDDDGHLVGLLNATLENPEPLQTQRVKASQSDSFNKTLAGSQLYPNTQKGGPADMTVGYTVGPDILRRVVNGFTSPTRKVLHPAVGLICINAADGGALIQEVKANSPAEKAGIQKGDIIIKMDDKPIKNQIDFARIIESKEIGDNVTLVITRDLQPTTYKLVVGTVQKAIKATEPGIG